MLSRKVSCHSDSSFCDLKWCFILNKRTSAGVNKLHRGCCSPHLTETDYGTEKTGHQVRHRTGICVLKPPNYQMRLH